MSENNLNLENELKYTASDFLCPECKNPLYFESESKKDVCLNKNCTLYPIDLDLYDVTQADALRREMRDKESKLRTKIAQMDRRSLVRFLLVKRKSIIKHLIDYGQVSFTKLLVIDELLILLNLLKVNGNNQNISLYNQLLDEYEDYFELETFKEDMENLRTLMATNKKVYMLKYWNVIKDLYQSYGIISDQETDLNSLFKHKKINLQAIQKVEFQPGMELLELFEQMFDFIIELKYMFERYYRTSKHHNYNPTSLDIAVLLGLYYSMKNDIECWSYELLQIHYRRNANGKGDFEQFMNHYISSTEVTPLLIFDGTRYCFDKSTLFIYILYLIGKNRRKIEGQIGTGVKGIIKKKQETSIIFEEYIRSHLRRCCFDVDDAPLIVSEQNIKFEFDIIGVKDDSKEIVFVEAKYKDFAPSSLTGKNIVQQELLDPMDGLLMEAIKQQARFDFVRNFANRFEQELSLTFPLEQYSMTAWIITKHTPLISKYKQVSIVSYDEYFCES